MCVCVCVSLHSKFVTDFQSIICTRKTISADKSLQLITAAPENGLTWLRCIKKNKQVCHCRLQLMIRNGILVRLLVHLIVWIVLFVGWFTVRMAGCVTSWVVRLLFYLLVDWQVNWLGILIGSLFEWMVYSLVWLTGWFSVLLFYLFTAWFPECTEDSWANWSGILSDSLVAGLTDWLVDSCAAWLGVWSVNCLAGWQEWLTGRLVGSSTGCWLVAWQVHWLIGWLILSLWVNNLSRSEPSMLIWWKRVPRSPV